MTYPYGVKGLPVVGHGLPGLPQREVARAVVQAVGELLVAESDPGSDWVKLDGGFWDDRLESLGIAPDWLNFTSINTPQKLNSFGLGGATTYSGDYLIAGQNLSPFMVLYRKNAGTLLALPPPVDLPVSSMPGPPGISGDGRYIAVPQNSAPYVIIYKREADDSLTRIASPFPTDAPSSMCYRCAFSSNGLYLAVAQPAIGRVSVYRRNGDSFTLVNSVSAGAELAQASGVEISGDGQYLAINNSTVAPALRVYRRNENDTFTELAVSPAPPTTTITPIGFSADGVWLARIVGSQIQVYRRNGNVMSHVSSVTVTAGLVSCALSGDGGILAVSYNTAPYILLYRRSGSTFTQLQPLSASSSGLSGPGATVLSGNAAFMAVIRSATGDNIRHFQAIRPRVEAVVDKAAYLKVSG